MDKIDNDTDILLINAYGETSKFFNISKSVFLGGSLIKHGGQNPIEPSRSVSLNAAPETSRRMCGPSPMRLIR